MEQYSEQKFSLQKQLLSIDGLIKRLKFLVIIIPGFCITGFFTGCKKECYRKPECSTITAVLHSSGKWFHLSYNSKDQLSRLSSGAMVTTYEYTGNTTIVTSLDSGRFFTKNIIALNALGLAVNVRTEKNAAGTNWFNTVYEYSGEELIKSTITLSDGGPPIITTYTWANQNMRSVISGTVINTFDYYMDKLRQKGDSFFLTQLFQGYEIYRNKNLLKSISGIDLTYEIGPVGIISAVAAISGNNTDILEYQVIYQCN